LRYSTRISQQQQELLNHKAIIQSRKTLSHFTNIVQIYYSFDNASLSSTAAATSEKSKASEAGFENVGG
jgi:hypothetical protein